MTYTKQNLLLSVSRKGKLDEPLTEIELAKISRHAKAWELKGCALGLTEVEVEDIKEDYKSNEMRRIAMLRKWGKKYGNKATLRSLIEISMDNSWNSFIEDVCASFGYIKRRKKSKLCVSLQR